MPSSLPKFQKSPESLVQIRYNLVQIQYNFKRNVPHNALFQNC